MIKLCINIIIIFFFKGCLLAKEFTTEVTANVDILSYELPNKTKYSIYKDNHTWKNTLGDYGKGTFSRVCLTEISLKLT